MTKRPFVGAAITVLVAVSLSACNPPAPAKPAADTGKIADAVKADVAQLVTDFNAHDATKVASHDAADVIQMAHGQVNTVGAAADLAANQKGFAADAASHVTVNTPSVDVAASGDMAVYRSTYVFNATDPKTKKSVTENGNYLAGYKLQPDGSWKIAWSIVSDTGPAPAAAPAKKG